MVSSDYQRRVHRVMDYVRRNLTRELKLDELAGVACFSPYHFHRVFTAVAGETVNEFTRRARLERAAYLMKASPRRALGSIALDAGFSSQSDFSRVFRATYGIAPSAWDRRSVLRAGGEEHLDGEAVGGVAERPGRFGRPEPPIRARVREHPARRVAYLRLRNPFGSDALPRAYDELKRWLEVRDVDWRECRVFGVSWDHYDATPLDQIRFDLGFSVPESVEPEGEIGIHEIPAVRSVDAHSHGPLLRIAQAWDYLYLEWLPRSGYEPDDVPALKRFRRRPDETGWEEWDVDCSIAIRPLRP